MKYKIAHTTTYDYSAPVPVSHNQVYLTPRQLPQQECESNILLIHPECANVVHRRDVFGNSCSHFSAEQPHKRIAITAKSVVKVSRNQLDLELNQKPSWEMVAAEIKSADSSESIDAYQFSLPSPAISILSEVRAYAESIFSPGRSIDEAATDLMSRIYSEFEYDPAATSVQSTIGDVLRLRRGVCQDFAHLQIACLRSLGLAARYVSGYIRTIPPEGETKLVGADASHAWLSIYCGNGKWLDLDPTNNQTINNDYVTLAWGRDYQDVSPVKGVIIGGGRHRIHVSVTMQEFGS